MASTKADEKMLNITNREMQSKTTMRYHLTSLRMAIIKKSRIINATECVEEREPFYTIAGNASWCSHCGKQYGGS